MSRSKSTSRVTLILAVVCGIFVLKPLMSARTAASDRITPAGGLFNFRRDRDRKSKEPEPPQSGGLALPPGVPIAPPAQFQGLGPLTNAPEDPVLRRVEEAIRITMRRYLNAENIGESSQHTPWQIMHGIVALRHDLELKSNRGMVNAIEFVSQDPVFRGEHWFEATRYGGRAHPFSIPYYFEGHVNQFLALLTMANLPLDHRFRVAGGRSVMMSDMVRHAQMTVNANEEISWTLWFLTHYLEPDASWVNAQGQRWGMETLVRLQTEDDVTTAPCGGSHGLFALSYARNSYLQKHGKLNGAWTIGDLKIQRCIESARGMQNKDGSFSTKFLKEAGFSQDPGERLKSSGHTLEWLMMAVRQPQLSEQWVRAGVYNVANDLIRFSNQPIDPGPLYHSLHSLVLYRERVTAPRSLDSTEAKPLLADASPKTTPRPGTPAPSNALPPNNAASANTGASLPQGLPAQEKSPMTPAADPPTETSVTTPVPKNATPVVTPGKTTDTPMPLKTPEIKDIEPSADDPKSPGTPRPEEATPKTPMGNTTAATPPAGKDVPVTESPMSEAVKTPEALKNEPAAVKDPKPLAPNVTQSESPKLPELPSLPGPEEGQLKAMLPERSSKIPEPDARPIQPTLAADPPPPPPLRIVQRNTDGLSKPNGAARKAPPPPVVNQSMPLPPMYLDPVDMPAENK